MEGSGLTSTPESVAPISKSADLSSQAIGSGVSGLEGTAEGFLAELEALQLADQGDITPSADEYVRASERMLRSAGSSFFGSRTVSSGYRRSPSALQLRRTPVAPSASPVRNYSTPPVARVDPTAATTANENDAMPAPPSRRVSLARSEVISTRMNDLENDVKRQRDTILKLEEENTTKDRQLHALREDLRTEKITNVSQLGDRELELDSALATVKEQLRAEEARNDVLNDRVQTLERDLATKRKGGAEATEASKLAATRLEELQRAAAKVATLETQLQAAREKNIVPILEGKINGLTDLLAQRSEQVNEEATHCKALQEKLDGLRKQNRVLSDDAKAAEVRCGEHEGRVGDAMSKSKTLGERNVTLERQVVSLRDELNGAEKRAEEARTMSDAAEERVAEAKARHTKELQREATERRALEMQHEALKQQLASSQEERSNLFESLEKARVDLSAMEGKMSRVTTQHADESVAIASIRSQNDALKTNEKGMQRELEELRRERDELMLKLDEFRSERTRYRAVQQDLEDTRESLAQARKDVDIELERHAITRGKLRAAEEEASRVPYLTERTNALQSEIKERVAQCEHSSAAVKRAERALVQAKETADENKRRVAQLEESVVAEQKKTYVVDRLKGDLRVEQDRRSALSGEIDALHAQVADQKETIAGLEQAVDKHKETIVSMEFKLQEGAQWEALAKEVKQENVFLREQREESAKKLGDMERLGKEMVGTLRDREREVARRDEENTTLKQAVAEQRAIAAGGVVLKDRLETQEATVKQLQTIIDELKAEVDQLRAALSVASTEKAAVEGRNVVVEGELKDLRISFDDQLHEVGRLKVALENSDAEQHRLRNVLNEQRRELERGEGERLGLVQEASTLRERSTQLMESATTRDRLVADQEKRIGELVAKVNDVTYQLDAESSRNSELENRVVELEAAGRNVSVLEGKVASLEAVCDRKDGEIAHHQTTIDELKTTLKAHDAEVSAAKNAQQRAREAKAELLRTVRKVDDLSNELEDIRKAKLRDEKSLHQLREDLAATKNQVSDKQEIINAAEAERVDLQRRVERLADVEGKLKGFQALSQQQEKEIDELRSGARQHTTQLGTAKMELERAKGLEFEVKQLKTDVENKDLAVRRLKDAENNARERLYAKERELDGAVGEVATLKTQLEQLRGMKETFESKCAKHEGRIEELTGALRDVEAAGEAERGRFEEELEGMREKSHRLVSTATNQESKIDELQADLATYRSRTAELERERGASNVDRQALQRQVEEKKTRMEKLEETIKALHTEREDLIARLQEAELRMEDLQAKNHADSRTLAVDFDRQHDHINQLKRQVMELGVALRAKGEDVEALTAARSALEQELRRRSTELSQLNEKIHVSGTTAEQLRRENRTLDSRCTQLECSNIELEKHVSHAKGEATTLQRRLQDAESRVEDYKNRIVRHQSIEVEGLRRGAGSGATPSLTYGESRPIGVPDKLAQATTPGTTRRSPEVSSKLRYSLGPSPAPNQSSDSFQF